MKRKFEELRENLDEFVEQDDFSLLVVGCLPDELAYVAQFLQGLEQKHPASFFVLFAQPFINAAGYLDGVVESIQLQVQAARPLRAERGEVPFPDVPEELLDHRQPAEQRLLSILRYLVSLLPNQADYRVVVGLLPLDCRDVPAYAKLVRSMIAAVPSSPSLAALRIVVYDDRTRHLLTGALRDGHKNHAHVLTYQVDFSTPALTDALTRDAADVALPVPERMASLLQLAALDYSYKRYPAAMEKYGVLYNYYQAQKIPSMQALCLNGAADTLRAAGQPVQAKDYLQRSIGLSMENKALPTLLNALISITEVSFELQQFDEAASYADSGARVAAAALNPFACADLHERKGDAQLAQGKTQESIESYRRCAHLCQMYEHFYRWKSVLRKLGQLHQPLEVNGVQRHARDELLRVEALEKSGRRAESGAAGHGVSA